jgi:hypothetical protein
MATTGLFTVCSPSIGGTVVVGITSQTFSSGVEEVIQAVDGTMSPSIAVCTGAEPMFTLESVAVAAVLDALSMTGLALGATPAYWYLEKLAATGRDATSAHMKFSQTKGNIVPVSLELSAGQLARITFASHAEYDGTNLPFVMTSNNALPTITIPSDVYTLGPVSINGTFLGGVQSVSLNFGISVGAFKGDGSVYPEKIINLSYHPSVRITTTEVLDYSTLGLIGIANTAFRLFARKVTGAGVVADATATNIMLSGYTGRTHIQSIRASQPSGGKGGEAMTEVTLTPTMDGTHDVITYSKVAAVAAA